jgi:hypothetical protein
MPVLTVEPLTAVYFTTFFDAAPYFEVTFDKNQWISTYDLDIIVFDGFDGKTAFFDAHEWFFDTCALM